MPLAKNIVAESYRSLTAIEAKTIRLEACPDLANPYNINLQLLERLENNGGGIALRQKTEANAYWGLESGDAHIYVPAPPQIETIAFAQFILSAERLFNNAIALDKTIGLTRDKKFLVLRPVF